MDHRLIRGRVLARQLRARGPADLCQPDQAGSRRLRRGRQCRLLHAPGVRAGWPTRKGYAFEPLPDNLQYLQRHLELNHITNATVIPAAVSESCGTGSFEEGPSRPASRLSKRGRLRVDVVALDALVSRGALPAPDFVKMDIEGGEAIALSGARTILEMNHPTVFLSTHGHDLQVECSELLHAHGYTLRDVTPRGDPFPQFLCVPRPTRDSSPPL